MGTGNQSDAGPVCSVGDQLAHAACSRQRPNCESAWLRGLANRRHQESDPLAVKGTLANDLSLVIDRSGVEIAPAAAYRQEAGQRLDGSVRINEPIANGLIAVVSAAAIKPEPPGSVVRSVAVPAVA